MDESFAARKPPTLVSLTERSRAAFVRYLDAMARLVTVQP